MKKVSYILLAISIFSMVLQNGLFNSVGKKRLKTGADTYHYKFKVKKVILEGRIVN